jgi:hypothetical protein
MKRDRRELFEGYGTLLTMRKDYRNSALNPPVYVEVMRSSSKLER